MEKKQETRTLKLGELRFDLTEDELHGHLSHFSPGGCSCLICRKENWAVNKVFFADRGYRAIPDSIEPLEFLSLKDADELGVKCSSGNYIFVCTNCGFSMKLNAAVVAVRVFILSEKNKA